MSRLHTVVNKAIAAGIITADPFAGYEPPRPERNQRYLTQEELERKIQLSLKPIEEEPEVIEEVALMEDNPRHSQSEEGRQPYIPSRLQQIADASGGRIVIGRIPSHRNDYSSFKKNENINEQAL